MLSYVGLFSILCPVIIAKIQKDWFTISMHVQTHVFVMN